MRFPHSLHWRIAIAYTALIFVTMGGVSIYLVNFVRDTFITNLESRLQEHAVLLGQSTAQYLQQPVNIDALQSLVNQSGNAIDAGIVIEGPNGAVLANTLESSNPAPLNDTFSAAVPILVDGNTVGFARVFVPRSELQSNVNRIVVTIVLSALMVAALSVGLSYLVARRTSRSVYSVAEGARRLASGDMEAHVQALVSDETSELASAFNSMAARIRRTVRDLSEERNKLSVVLETMADGVIVIDNDNRVSLMNSAAEWFLGTRIDATRSGRLSEVVRDHELQELVVNTMESGQPHHAEVELLHRRRFLSAIATPLRNDSPDSVVLTLHDLTRIRQVENTRKEFVANVSHELRSPLAAIRAMVETLEAGAVEDPKAATDFLSRIRRDVDRMNNIVNELLELSRLESGQTALHLAPLNLIPLITEVATQCGGKAQSQKITILPSLPDSLPPVIAEEQKIHQVLLNLVENALRFTGEKGTITISALEKDRFVEVQVKDTGTGISPDHIPHVFERFYKVDRSRRDAGTGLGLAIVKHIVQAHGGSVGVESSEGVGSTFSFTLPRATWNPHRIPTYSIRKTT
jgi:two-component system phosphate regulon sensor histidine kinase PhoR